MTHLVGTLVARQPDGSTRLLAVKSALRTDDVLSTQQATFARVRFADGTEVALRPNSQLAVKAYAYQADKPTQDSMALDLRKGGMRLVTGLLGKRNPDQVRVDTPAATIGIRGTHFGLLHCAGDCGDIATADGRVPPDGLHADVAEGKINVRNEAGEVVLHAGEFGHVPDGNSAPQAVAPAAGFQVTLPESITRNDAAGRSVGEGRNDCNCAVR